MAAASLSHNGIEKDTYFAAHTSQMRTIDRLITLDSKQVAPQRLAARAVAHAPSLVI